MKPSLLLSIVVFIQAVIYPSKGEARFDQQDADEIDRESRVSSEYYNDILSYLYPHDWQDRWRKSKIGYRVNAGSLNANRFHYSEDIKFESSTQGLADFAYYQETKQGILEQSRHGEIRVGYLGLSPLKIAMLAEGGTFKKWGDIGLALRLNFNSNTWLEAYYWSVDHYYNTKEEIQFDYYDKTPKSYGFKGVWESSQGSRLDCKIAIDTPVHWQRSSKKSYYKATKKDISLFFRYPVSRFQHLNFYLESVEKEEANWIFDEESDSQYKNMLFLSRENKQVDRRASWFGGEYMKFLNQKAFFARLDYAFRKANYIQSPGYADLVSGERQTNNSTRSEWMLSSGIYCPWRESDRMLYAIQYNRMEISEDFKKSRGELKFQTAFDYEIESNIRALLNITWDVDEVYREFGERFRPWGGGNIQFQALF